MSHYWFGRSGTPRQAGSIKRWRRWIKTANRVLRRQSVNGATVSTIFLGKVTDGALYETAILTGPHAGLTWRSATAIEADDTHNEVARLLRAGVNLSDQTLGDQPADLAGHGPPVERCQLTQRLVQVGVQPDPDRP